MRPALTSGRSYGRHLAPVLLAVGVYYSPLGHFDSFLLAPFLVVDAPLTSGLPQACPRGLATLLPTGAQDGDDAVDLQQNYEVVRRKPSSIFLLTTFIESLREVQRD